jgi:hypothetical protein
MIERPTISGSLYDNAVWGKPSVRSKSVSNVKSIPARAEKDYSGALTVFPDVFSTSKPKYCLLSDVIDRIRAGNSRELVEKIRSISDKSEREALKKKLPSICFSGIFTQRNNASLIKHSGFVVLDYDNVPMSFKAKVCQNPYVRAAFVSPTGTGLKIVVKISGDHVEVVKRLGEYFPAEGLDLQTDVSRVCFESYDPDVYFNDKSLEFNGKQEL